MSAIQADYRTNKHIPSRKCYQLIMEVPEESFPEVCRTLGYPTTGQNVYVGIARLTEQSSKTEIVTNSSETKTEGEKLLARAHILCKDTNYLRYVGDMSCYEVYPEEYIYNYCSISSRAELLTNIGAQGKFKELLSDFDSWIAMQQYKDNLAR